ncbi:MAG TPA: hypothetical protein PLW95_02240 [bacterium]|nr:hypothetical protein [bacterium]
MYERKILLVSYLLFPLWDILSNKDYTSPGEFYYTFYVEYVKII